MKKLLIILLLSIAGQSKAQDFHLSMYDASPIFLNPAMTGVFDGQWRIHGQFRTQWKSVNFKPYTTGLVSFDMPYKKWGFGMQISNNRAGAGNYNVFEALASAAYTIPLTKNRFHNLSFGAQVGVKQKTIEYQLLSYNNQYTTDDGGGFHTAIAPGENFGAQSGLLPASNIGIMYYHVKQQSRLNPFFGLSAFNLLTPDESFVKENSSSLPRRYYLHAGTRINITELFYLIPKVLLMHQQSFNEQTVALDAGYYFESSDFYLIGGAVYRTKDAMILSLGARMDNFIARIGYDINVSSLSLTSTGRGGFEISFTYMKATPKNPSSKICPRL
jgi:type IX secretion system PorP/SprF family membrane protein